jgi:hypothetical protein
MKPFALRTFAAIGLGLVVLYACQDTPEVTEQSTAIAAVSRKLTVSGTGTGTGVVTSQPAGIRCTITAGTAASTGCTAFYNHGVVVTLNAKPASGHSFVGWGITPCKEICTLPMTKDRAFSAQFLKGPFTIRISSGTTGVGSGRVRSQTGLTPAINCLITNGTPATTGCSAKYPAYTVLTLTATPAAGFDLTSWRVPSCGSGICQFPVIQNLAIPVTFSRVGSSIPAVEGRWNRAFATPLLSVHMHLLPTRQVLLWAYTGESQLWDPANGFIPVTKTTKIFCSGHTFLPDGRLLVAGGTAGAGTRGLRVASVFDPSTRSWSPIRSMAQGRYYPTTTTLPNGEILVVSGHDTSLTVVTIPEVWNGSAWRRLTTAPLSIPSPYYPAMFVAPNGKLFLAGFQQATRYLDVGGTGQWTMVANRKVADRRTGSAVMYAPGKILYAGGGNPPTASAEVIDLNQASPSWRTVSRMAFARRQMNATLLADGSVLVTGGTSGAGSNDQAGAVHAAELWNPRTESWTTMAPETKNRTYHSSALLLPDGRVVSSGSGGEGVPLINSELSAQVFSPPYLFNSDGSPAPRPTITSAPSRLAYGQSFTVGTPDAGTIARGSLIRLSSVTHAFNQSQLIYHLTFATTGSTTVRATAPASGNLAPPGPYMLFLISESGVPSEAKMVTVGP